MSDDGRIEVDSKAVLQLAFDVANHFGQTTSITVSALALGFVERMMANGFEKFAAAHPELGVDEAAAEFMETVKLGQTLYDCYTVRGKLAGVEFECTLPTPDEPEYTKPKAN
jgi:hypothetical protein